MKRLLRSALLLAALFAAAECPAYATEGGGGIYPNGAESFLTAVVPPPGNYLIDYLNYYEAQRFNDGSGNELIPDFRVDAASEAARYVRWSKRHFLGAQFGQQVVLAYVSLDVRAAGAFQHKSGLSDLTIDPVLLSWQNARFHFVLSPEFTVPTGNYVKGDLANIGRNYFNVEPLLAFSYTGLKNFEFDAKFMYDINGENTATHYTSGNEFHTDYGLGYTNRGLWLGVGGYYYTQTTDDTINGVKVGPDGFRGRVFSYGPDVHVALKWAVVAAKWEHETDVRYRPQGDKFWIKLITHLGNP